MTDTADHRRHPRQLVLRTGKLDCAEAGGLVDCALLNISRSGACLLVPDGSVIPNSVSIMIDGDTEVRRGNVAWRAGARIGVAFD
jgi:hypothetical protein